VEGVGAEMDFARIGIRTPVEARVILGTFEDQMAL